MSYPILLIAPQDTAPRVVEALGSELNLGAEVAPNRRAGLALLRRHEYVLVLLDEQMAATDPAVTDTLYQNAGAAPVLEMNFAISGAARVVRQVKAALVRRAQDQERARVAATVSLQNELNAALSGLLLESQLALRAATPEQAPKLRHVVALADGLREKLRAH